MGMADISAPFDHHVKTRFSVGWDEDGRNFEVTHLGSRIPVTSIFCLLPFGVSPGFEGPTVDVWAEAVGHEFGTCAVAHMQGRLGTHLHQPDDPGMSGRAGQGETSYPVHVPGCGDPGTFQRAGKSEDSHVDIQVEPSTILQDQISEDIRLLGYVAASGREKKKQFLRFLGQIF
jgi:hypothetical protein